MLVQQRASEAHAVCAFWAGPGRRFSHWYVNFQDPFRRRPDGFATFDHAVDLIVEIDGTYRWKDIEEFERLAAEGRFTATEAAAIRTEMTRVAAALDQGHYWWKKSYSTRTPPRTWE